MVNTFAIDVIRTFRPEESKSFKAFLSSPFCQKSHRAEELERCFQLLYDAVLKGEIAVVEKQDLFRLLFQDSVFIESKLDKLLSDLKQSLEDFLAFQRYFSEQSASRRMLDLNAELRQRGLESRYFQSLNRAQKHADQQQESLRKLLLNYEIAAEEHEWHCTFNKGKGELGIPEAIKALETYYYAKKIWMLNHLMFMQKVNSSLTITQDWESVELSRVSLERLNNPFLNICWQVYTLLINSTFKVGDFQRLLQEIKLNESIFEEESLSELYTYIRNICVVLIDQGNVDLYPTLNALNKENLKRGHFYIENKISPNACLNVTYVALNAGDVAWAEAFLEEHKERIIDETEERNFYRLNKAVCLFGNKKYEEALEMIPFGSSYTFYHLMARRLELKIYYELDSELLDHKIDAFKMFISRAGRRVFSENLHELFANFINIVRQLHQSRGPKAKQRSQTLIQRINEKKMIAERLWLLEKARELGAKK